MKILVLSPHPDDEAIGCGGTLRGHADRGDEVFVVFLTSGELGGHGRQTGEAMRVREKEARKAARILGVRKIEFWRESDGNLKSSRGLIERTAQAIDSWGASRIYVPHERESHPDHRAAARLARSAARQVKNGPEVLMFEVWTPLLDMDEVVDISRTMRAKLAAIRAYASQCSVVRFDDAMEGLARYRGELFSWPKPDARSGKYAEIFRRQGP